MTTAIMDIDNTARTEAPVRYDSDNHTFLSEVDLITVREVALSEYHQRKNPLAKNAFLTLASAADYALGFLTDKPDEDTPSSKEMVASGA
jgi:hypothetical protein